MRADSVQDAANGLSLNIRTPGGSVAHILPDTKRRSLRGAANGAADTGPLLYHNGTIVQQPFIYQVFWAPNQLQNGGQTGFSPNYINVNMALAAFYNSHGIGNITTQYFEVMNGQYAYPQNNGALVAAVIDQNPYPASGCNDPVTPGNCLTDAQVQAELLNVIQAENWQVGLNSIFMVYTSSGEGSCFAGNSPQSGCAAPGGYCAYHSYLVPNGNLNNAILYANIPYPPSSGCFGNGTSPNNDVDADTAATAASHELTETITDPLIDAWYTAQGSEIGDLCNQFFYVNTYSNGLANQRWAGWPFELQAEFDNHSGQCVQIGPLYVTLGLGATAALQ